VSSIALVLLLELVLRLTLDYHIDYYAGTTRPGRVEYPYGHVLINSHGQPDLEWDLADPRPRLAFYGDSVTYGVGAGHGHRISDLVRDSDEARQVLTFAAVGARLKDPERVARLADEFGIDAFVYVMNLNDLTPDRPRAASPRKPAAEPSEPSRQRVPGDESAQGAAAAPAAAPMESPRAETRDPWVRRLRAFVLENEGGLRSRSYLYNFLRLRAKNLLTRLGYEASGFRAVELEPSKHPEVFEATAERINRTATLLAESGVRFCVLILPYEMQISAEAERRYRELGIPFDADFVEGATQAAIRALLDPATEVLDGRLAFGTRDRNGLGEFFVYDRGDKIDWNHPTRAGHRRLADLMLAEGFCGAAAGRSDP